MAKATESPERRPGPKPGANREQVLAVARRRHLAGESFDVSAIAEEAGVGRTTIYRWFGDRDGLLGEMLGRLATETVERLRGSTSSTAGAERILAVIEGFIGATGTSEPLIRQLNDEPAVTLGVILGPDSPVHTELVRGVTELIAEETEAGRYAPTLEPGLLAALIVEIGAAHLWSGVLSGQTPQIESANELCRALITLESDDRGGA